MFFLIIYEIYFRVFIIVLLDVLVQSENQERNSDHINQICKINEGLCLIENISFENGKDFELNGLNVIESLEINKIQFINSKLPEIPNGFSIILPQLEDLDMSNVELKTLNSNNFENAVKLKRLNLSSNFLNEIAEKTFHMLILEVIDLSKNKINKLENNAFSGLLHLQTLLLQGNKLKTIDGTSISYAPKLKNLDLSDNLLESLETGFSNSVDKLKNLNLGNNNISIISKDTFVQFTDLRILSIRSNPLKTFATASIMHLHNLTHLDTSNTSLDHFNFGPLQNHSKLFEINLSDNNLTELSYGTDAESASFSIKNLNLNSNKLRNINGPDFIGKFPELQNLSISNNPFDCQELKIFMDNIKTMTNITFVIDPSFVIEKKFNFEKISCNWQKYNSIWYIYFGVTLTILGICAVSYLWKRFHKS